MRNSIFALLICLPFAAPTFAGDGQIHRKPEPVAGLYLVSLENVADSNIHSKAQELLARVGGQLRLTFTHAASGFSAKMTEKQAAILARDPLVDFVEEVGLMHLSSSPQNLPSDNTLWQLDRIDQPSLPFDHEYYYCESGAGVTAYLIGTGVYYKHTEFANPDGSSRVVRGTKFTGSQPFDPDNSIAPGDTVDYGYWPCGAEQTPGPAFYSGHDTAVASVLGGKTYGVAKGVTIVPIRITDCTHGTFTTDEDVNFAIDWIMTPYNASTGAGNPYYGNRPAVVSMSSYEFTQECDGTSGQAGQDASFLENEINKLVGHPYVNGVCTTPGPGEWSGIPMVVSANNQNSSNSHTSPARMAFSNTSFGTCGRVISAGGIDENDHRWVCNPSMETCATYLKCPSTLSDPNLDPPTGSNYGPTVDIFAPAHNLTLAGITSSAAQQTNYAVRSGTSYSAPIVAGIVARIEERTGSSNPEYLWSQLQSDAAHAASAIDPVTGNDKIVNLPNQQTCNPPLP